MVSKADSGDASTLGANVGSNTKTLTVNNLPSHTHTYSKSPSTTGSTTLTTNQIPSHNHKNPTYGLIRAADESSGFTASTGSGFYDRLVVTSKGDSTLLINTGGGQGHSHTITSTTANSGATGSASEINVMQSSKVCIRWHRTA